MVASIQNFAVFISLISSLCNAQPDAPTGLSVTSSKSNELSITWTDSATPGANHKVYVGTAAASEANTVAASSPFTATSTTGASPTPLVGNTEYNVAVYAVDATDSTLVSTALSGTGTTVFAAPILNPPTNPTSSSIDLAWNASGNGGGASTITGYTISYTGGGGGTQDVTGSSAISATISPLDSNTAYSFTIAAKSSTGTGDSSTAQSGTTLPDKVVLAANTTTATINTIGLNWIPVSGGVPVTYTVTWIPATGGSPMTGISSNSACVSALTASTQYTFNVVAVNSAGSSADSGSDNSQYSTLPNAPAAPSLSPGSDATNMIVVSWTAPSGGNDIVDYVVEWTANSTFATKVATPPTTLTSLTPGELYRVNVKARNSAGAGAKPQSASHRTNPPKPTAVTLSQPTSDKTTSLEVTWSMIGTGYIVSSYIINLTPANGGSNAPTVTYTATSTDPTNKIVGGLTPGESYTATVQAVSNGVSGSISDPSPSQGTDLCQLATCLNGGTCNQLPLNYSCSCLPGYSGRNCETDLCTPNPCANGGGCSRIVGDYKCLCEPGFAGRNCNQARFYSFENGCELHINKISTQLTSHEAAETQCISLQASLAIVKSEEAQIYLNQINQLWLNNVPIWLGGKLTNLTWLWSDGSNVDGYNNLVDQSAPNGDGCLSLARNGSWFAQNCSTSIGYACERRVDGTSLCASSPCDNGGVCTESGCHFHCTCQPNFSGFNCEILPLSAETKLVLYIILPICVILIMVGIAVICIRRRSKGGREAAEVPSVQFAVDPRTVYEEIQSPLEGEYENLAIRS